MSETIKQNKMGYAKMLPLILSMALPAMFSMTVMALYNVVDSIFLGHLNYIGEEGYRLGNIALKALGFAYPLQLLMISFTVGTAVGVNSLIARRLGAKAQKEADCAATHGIILALFTWILFIFIGLFAVKPFLSICGCDEETLKYGTQYLTIVLCFSGFSMVQVSVEKSIQATGDMIFPMLFQLAGAVTNIIFDPLFIYGIGPFPRLEVMGAAVATVFGQFVGMVFALVVLFKRKNRISVNFKGFKLNKSTVKNIYAVGFPSIIMQSISAFMMIGMNTMLTEDGVAVLGVYFKLQSFVFMPCFGLNQGVLPVIGFNYGAKNKKRMYSAMKVGICIAMSIMMLGTILFLSIPDRLIGLFNNSPLLLEIAVPAFRKICLCFIPAAVSIIFITLFQAVGKGFRALALSFTRQLIFLLPIAFVIKQMMGESYMTDIWYAFPLAEIGSLICAAVLFIQLKNTEFKKLDK